MTDWQSIHVVVYHKTRRAMDNRHENKPRHNRHYIPLCKSWHMKGPYLNSPDTYLSLSLKTNIEVLYTWKIKWRYKKHIHFVCTWVTSIILKWRYCKAIIFFLSIFILWGIIVNNVDHKFQEYYYKVTISKGIHFW